MERVLTTSEVSHLKIQDGRPAEYCFHYNSKTIRDNQKIPTVFGCFQGRGVEWNKF